MRAFIGAATSGGQGGPASGITVADIEKGVVTPVGEPALSGVGNPMYLALSRDGRVLYAIHEVGAGAVSAWAVDGAVPRPLSEPRSTGGDGPCHLSLHPSGRFLLTADYGSGSLSVHPIGADGALGEATHVVQHEGSGPDQQRQGGPHAHMIVTDPVRGHVLAADLGTDTVYRYVLDDATGRLSLADEIAVAPGSGPRHLVVRDRYAYVVTELASTVTVIDLDTPEVITDVATHVDDGRGPSYPSAIRLGADGRFLYVANRFVDDIAVLSVDGPDVALVATVPCGGSHPRDLELDPDGRYLYVANQFSDQLVSFRVDERTGVPEPTGHVLSTPSPASILFG
ncbi:lactonase family protein [Jiangella alkaliphila]|uniref:6-phosphogluconolactonase, cycloisomerase 2 family n=1 Tax=Jiangella alkaliphila TaxID=419479 RepID=A0A1H2I586_9ACTN|nr:lactonase family protein [Jiangella alkaliphila]SDU39174.1 6-phosphogluconolactonase, cycloisomerase 2 family [Jiangella alkaliphila]